LTVVASADTKTVDVRKDKASPRLFELRITAISTDYDHVYVTFGKEDEAAKMSTMSYVGFYPADSGTNKNDIYDFIVRGVHGQLSDEDRATLAHPPVHQLIARVDASQMQAAEAVRDQRWKEDKTYRYGINDCVSFANEVAKAAGIKTPSTVLNPSPLRYVKAIVAAN
jgi:hypothetical protein